MYSRMDSDRFYSNLFCSALSVFISGKSKHPPQCSADIRRARGVAVQPAIPHAHPATRTVILAVKAFARTAEGSPAGQLTSK